MYVNGKHITDTTIRGGCNGVIDILIAAERVAQHSLAEVTRIGARGSSRDGGSRIDPGVGSTRGNHIAAHCGIEGVESITGANAKGSGEIADECFWLYLYANGKRISDTTIRSGCNGVIDILIAAERVAQHSLAEVTRIGARGSSRDGGSRIDPSVGSARGNHIASHRGIEGVESITGTNAKGSSEIADDGFWFHF